MLLQKSKKFNPPRFYYEGARILEGLTLYHYNLINLKNNPAALEFKYQQGDDGNICDQENIQLLKEELGTEFIEKQMYKQFTRNNHNDDFEIKNNFQINLSADFQKQNNFLASMILYFLHKFYNDGNVNGLDKYKNAGILMNEYRNIKTNGLPSAKIIEEIKTVYPYLNNLLVKLLQIKYVDQANIALMNIQDAKEQLKEAELIGQIQKIKVKKPSKLDLAKK